jgi:hypothetical protein
MWIEERLGIPIRSPIDGILEAIGGSMQTSVDPRMNESSAYYE